MDLNKLKDYWREAAIGCLSLVMASLISYIAWDAHLLVQKINNMPDPDRIVTVERFEASRNNLNQQIVQLQTNMTNLMIALSAQQRTTDKISHNMGISHMPFILPTVAADAPNTNNYATSADQVTKESKPKPKH